MMKPVVPGFETKERIGRGGMGDVFEAVRVEDGRVVALKVLLPQLADDQSFRTRFEREVSLARSIEHPNVVRVIGSGVTEEGQPYLEMDLIDGQDLQSQIAVAGKLQSRLGVRLLEQVASGLDAVHEAGLIHRDVKPANILLDASGQHAFVSDFGLARSAASDSALTDAGKFLGSIDYVAPEQIQSTEVDARADIYALGCVFFHALTGKPPFPRADSPAKMWAHVHESPPSLESSDDPDLRLLADVFDRALAKDPLDRFPSAGDFAEAANAAIEGRAVTRQERYVGIGDAAPTRLLDRPRSTSHHWYERKWLRRTAAGSIGCLAVGAVLALALGGGGSKDTQTPAELTESAAAAPKELQPSPPEGKVAEEVTADGRSETNLSSYCSPTGDYCQKVLVREGEVRAWMGQFSFGNGSFDLCMEDPAGESSCRGVAWDEKGNTGMFESDVSITQLFEPTSPGEYGVSWNVGGSKVGKTLEFRLLEESAAEETASGPGYEEFSGSCSGGHAVFPEGAKVGYAYLEAIDASCDYAAEVAADYVRQWRLDCDGLPDGCEIDSTDGIPCSFVSTAGPQGEGGIGCYAARTGVEFIISYPDL